MSDTNTAAPTATEQMMEAYVKGDSAGAQALSPQVNREAGIEQPQQSDPLALTPTPAAPQAPAGEVDKARAKLTELGGEHAALVQSWGSQGQSGLRETGIQRHRCEPAGSDCEGRGKRPWE
jgi:hypothetical protein